MNCLLHHIQLGSPDPGKLAQFYERAMGTKYREIPGGIQLCSGPNRLLLVSPGPAKQLDFAGMCFPDRKEFEEFKQRLQKNGTPLLSSPSPIFGHHAFSVLDPDKNRLVFDAADDVTSFGEYLPSDAPGARLQHIAFGTPQCSEMLSFYKDVLGFSIVDRVCAANGDLRTCFVRSSKEHHTVAIFQSPEARVDHNSHELDDWNGMRDWADRFGAQRIEIMWGPGRHGPGNNLFFFLYDSDQNWLEFSAEIEVFHQDRPEALWPHEEHTLNLWGRGILRS